MLEKFEQNHMVQAIKNFELFNKKKTKKKKTVNHFWQSVDAILQDVSVTEQLFDAKLPSFSVPKIMLVWHV